MSLKSQIEDKFKKALSERNEVELSLFRLIKSAIKNSEIAKGQELEDAAVLAVLEKEAKQRQDSITQYNAGGRADLAEKEQVELVIIQKFLPEKLSEQEVRTIVKDLIAKNPGLDFGKMMGVLMGELKGKADGGLVQKVAREELGA
jgi:uncharacterized protein YqeY